MQITSRRCSKRCACLAKRGGTQKHHSLPNFRRPPMKVLQVLRLPRKNEPEMLQVLRLPRKNEPDMLQALRLPRKTSLRRACHAKRGGAQKHHSSPDFRQPLCRCAKCCACHAKTSLRLPRKTRRRPKASHVGRLPPTPMKVLQVLRLPRKNEPDMLQALRLPRKTRPEARLPRQNEAAPKSITRRQTSANLYEGAQSAAPATQNEPEMLQVLRLPHRRRRRPKASLVAKLPPTSMKVLQVLRLPTQKRT